MYNIEKLYQSMRFRLTEVRVSGKKQTAGTLCFRGSPTKLDRTGKVVCAIEDGVVTTSDRCYDPGSREFRRGRIVEIAGASGVTLAYGRLASANVRKGDMVRAGEPIGIEGNSGAGNGEYLTLEFRRNDRRVDGCGLLGIANACPQEWTEPKGEPVLLIDANELVKHACEMRGTYGSEMAVPLRYIADAPTIGKEEVKDGTMD